MSKRRLGKGIDALLQGRPLDQLSQMSSIMMVDLDHISPNPNQPRKQFNQERLNELAASIREKGVIQPILAEDQGDGTYTIIAGERRCRAARLAGLSEIPVISQELTEEDKLEVALIENIQREDLNPVDEARAFQSALVQSGATQDQLARRLGKSRSAIANSLRLLRLDDDIQDALAAGTLTAGHARTLLALTDSQERRTLFDKIRGEDLSVREAEYAVKGGSLDLDGIEHVRHAAQIAGSQVSGDRRAKDPPAGGSTGDAPGPEKSLELRRLEDLLVEHLGTRVVIRGNDDRGRIEIAYLSTQDLERVIESMGAELPE